MLRHNRKYIAFAALIFTALLVALFCLTGKRQPSPTYLKTAVWEADPEDKCPDLYWANVSEAGLSEQTLLYGNQLYTDISKLDTNGVTTVFLGVKGPIPDLVILAGGSARQIPMAAIDSSGTDMVPLLTEDRLYVAVSNSVDAALYEYHFDTNRFLPLDDKLPVQTGEYRGQFAVCGGQIFYIDAGRLKCRAIQAAGPSADAVVSYENSIYIIDGSTLYRCDEGMNAVRIGSTEDADLLS